MDLIEMHRTHLIFCPVLEVLAAENGLDEEVLQLVVAVSVEKDRSGTEVGGAEKTKGGWRWWRRSSSASSTSSNWIGWRSLCWRGGGAVEAEHHS